MSLARGCQRRLREPSVARAELRVWSRRLRGDVLDCWWEECTCWLSALGKPLLRALKPLIGIAARLTDDRAPFDGWVWTVGRRQAQSGGGHTRVEARPQRL